MSELDVLDHCYPPSFVSNNDEISTRLQVLSNNALLDSVLRFSQTIPNGQRTKAGFKKLIMDDFQQHTNELVRLSTEALYQLVSPPPHCPKIRLPLICQFVHERYGPTVASHLLCHSTRWNPPDSMVDNTLLSSVDWLQVPVHQLKSRLSKVEFGAVQACCHLYLSPGPPPKSKTGKYTVVAERFRSRSVFLFGLSEGEFLKHHIALFPYALPTPQIPRQQLVEGILREEFGLEISGQHFLPPASVRKK